MSRAWEHFTHGHDGFQEISRPKYVDINFITKKALIIFYENLKKSVLYLVHIHLYH